MQAAAAPVVLSQGCPTTSSCRLACALLKPHRPMVRVSRLRASKCALDACRELTSVRVQVLPDNTRHSRTKLHQRPHRLLCWHWLPLLPLL